MNGSICTEHAVSQYLSMLGALLKFVLLSAKDEEGATLLDDGSSAFFLLLLILFIIFLLVLHLLLGCHRSRNLLLVIQHQMIHSSGTDHV